MKTILFPTDFSDNSLNALDYAIGLAKEENAKIVLINAWEIIYPASDFPLPGEYITEQISINEMEALKQLKALSLKVQENNKVECEYISRQGLVVDVVIELIKKHHTDLVIMGTNGASGFREFFIGSNTAKVIKRATCPVLAVPSGVKYNGLKKITYELAHLFLSELTLLHISDKDESQSEATQTLKAYTEKIASTYHFENLDCRLIYGNDKERELDEYVRSRHADLFVISSSHHSLFNRLFGDDKIKTLAYHTKIPLMVFHHTDNKN